VPDLHWIDWIAVAIVALAIVRGLMVGVIRQVISIAALVAAFFVARQFAPQAGSWLVRISDASIDPQLAPWLGAAGLAIGTLIAGAVVGRVLRRGAQIVFLGLPDRIGGGLVGAAEGVLVCAVLLFAATLLIGRDHPLIDGSRSIAALERIEQIAGVTPKGVDVAAPPPQRSR
jgi:membrane protein required for colicin V production